MGPSEREKYELVLPFGDLQVGTVFALTGKSAFDFLAGGRTVSIEVEIHGQTRWLHEREDGPLRGRTVPSRTEAA